MALYDDFISILSDHINKKETKLELTDELWENACNHSLTSIIFQQTAKPEEAQAYGMKFVFRYLQRKSLENEIKNIFKEAGIPYFFVKGTAVADYYPTPALRTMSDSDIVVKDRPAACKVLEKAGFEITDAIHSDWSFQKNEIHFELHDHLLYGNLLNPQKHLEFFDKCWEFVKDDQLDWNFHFLFLLEHLRKHLVWEGVGFRQFLDIAVMIKYGTDLFDWDWIREQLRELDMDGFTDVCFSLIERWFEIDLPYEVPKATDELYNYASAKILENGVFGYSGEKYKDEAEREIYLTETNEDSYHKTIVKRFVGRIFPSYEELVAWPQYSFIKGRKYLLPVCWIYRLFKGIFNPEKVGKNVKWSQMSREQFDRYNDELKKWGL